MENQEIEKDPADDESMGSMLRNVFRKMMMQVDGMLPARVVSYDRAGNTATVQPLISLLTSSGGAVSRAPLASVPVLAIGGGGFVINFPLKAGDMGWIEASDRDIALFMQAEGNDATQPNSKRLHSFSDGRFVPDVFDAYTIAGDDDANMVIQSLDGAVCISLSETKIKLKAPTIETEGNFAHTGGGTFIINGIPFGTHRHTNVESGPNTSGGPTV